MNAKKIGVIALQVFTPVSCQPYRMRLRHLANNIEKDGWQSKTVK